MESMASYHYSKELHQNCHGQMRASQLQHARGPSLLVCHLQTTEVAHNDTMPSRMPDDPGMESRDCQAWGWQALQEWAQEWVAEEKTRLQHMV
jgi:hypothetical protein